ncbi:MAG: phosphoglycerate dehydrogenase [Candidatus Sericytochromatia bacterium]|nr:phosphoglycerate dehydrogenase [Candidatus Tanganyikabacteria bacterium]
MPDGASAADTRAEQERSVNGASGPYRVLACDHIDPAGLAILSPMAQVDSREPLSPADLARLIGDYDALLVRSATKVTNEVFEAAGRLKIVGRAGVGVDNIDVAAATRHGVIVVNSPEGNTVAAAEHAVGLMLALARRIPGADGAMKDGQWGRERFVGIELYHKILGILGLGKIGQRVATVARALGMRVIGTDPFLTPDKAAELGIDMVDFDRLLAESDFITIHVPRTPDTTHLFGEAAFARIKPGVRLINCARGGIVDEAALAAALRSGRVAGAALDVFEKEPLGESALRDLGDQVVLTPHLGASTEEAQLKVAVDVAEQVAAVLAGEPARSAVNIPSMRPEHMEPVRPFLQIAEKLGLLLGQLLDGPVRRLEVVYSGGLAERNTDPLTTAVLKGLLSGAVAEGVNYVNAPIVAKERGLEVRSSRTSEAGEFHDLLEVSCEAGAGVRRTVAGTLFGEGNPRIVRIDEQRFNMEPEGHILIAPHEDVPGVVGRIGTLLGSNNINIFGLQLGRKFRRGPAVMALNVDEAIPPPLLETIGSLPGFHDVKCVKL